MELAAITEAVVFYLFAALAVLAGCGVLLAKSPVRSALSLAVVFLCLAVMYLLLNAPFIAAAQVMIYAGAVLILFLFVIMVLNPRLDLGLGGLSAQTLAALAVGLALLFELGLILTSGQLAPAEGKFTPEFVSQVGHVQVIGTLLFSEFVLPFEIASALLLVAIVGAITLARREDTEREFERRQSRGGTGDRV